MAYPAQCRIERVRLIAGSGCAPTAAVISAQFSVRNRALRPSGRGVVILGDAGRRGGPTPIRLCLYLHGEVQQPGQRNEHPVVLDARPIGPIDPPRGVGAIVVAVHEKVEVVRFSRYGGNWRRGWEEAADGTPVVVDACPVDALEPPGGVDTAVVSGDEQVEIAGRPRNRRQRRGGWEEAADGTPVVVDA